MEGESGFTRSIIDELHSLDNEQDQMEGKSCVSRSFRDEVHSGDFQGVQMKGENMVVLEVSLMNFIFQISKEIKWKVKKVLLEVS